MSTNNQDNAKISPEEYNRILKSIQLIEIFLTYTNAKTNRNRIESPLKVDTDLTCISFEEQEDGSILINTKCRLTAFKSNKKNYAIYIEIHYGMIIQSEEDISEEFFDIYKRLNLPVNIWPYFREFVQNITQRMNVPPLTLPFYKT